jgi:ABC-type lipoprotein release transport system permease subunit
MTGVLRAMLFGVAPLEPATFVTVAVVTVGSGLLATTLPALTATRVDPTVALRGE